MPNKILFCISFMLVSQLTATYTLRIREGLSGKIILDNHFDNKEQFDDAIKEIDKKFDKHLARTAKISMYVSELWPLEDILPEADPFIHEHAGNQVVRNTSLTRENCYELSLVKISDHIITEVNYATDALYLFVYTNSGNNFVLCFVYTHDNRDLLRGWVHSFQSPIRANDLFAIPTALDEPIQIQWVRDNDYITSEDRAYNLLYSSNLFALSYENFNQLLEEFEHVCAGAIINPLQAQKPEAHCIKLALKHIRTNYTYESLSSTQYISTDLIWPFLELPDGPLDLCRSKDFMKIMCPVAQADSIEIRKTGLRFDLYPAYETEDSRFRVHAMYIKPTSTPRDFVMFCFELYDPSYGYFTIYASKKLLDVRKDEYLTMDFCGFDHAGIETIEDFILGLQNFISAKQINCYRELYYWDTCFGKSLWAIDYNLDQYYFQVNFNGLKDILSKGKRTGRGPLMTISPATE